MGACTLTASTLTYLVLRYNTSWTTALSYALPAQDSKSYIDQSHHFLPVDTTWHTLN